MKYLIFVYGSIIAILTVIFEGYAIYLSVKSGDDKIIYLSPALLLAIIAAIFLILNVFATRKNFPNY